MNNKSVYTSIIAAKNGTEIPVFANGRTVDSKYNPDREAENLTKSIYSSVNKNTLFFIVIGIGSGTFIEKLAETYPESKIIGIEKSIDDLVFLNKLEKIRKLKEDNNNVILTYIDNIENVLINSYLPAIYGEFKIIEQQGWIRENQDCIKTLNNKINRAMGIISADFSVQTHFGKIWQFNIINNLKNLSDTANKTFNSININKTAVVVAAGPSLDKNIKKIQEKRDKYFIISTDTAFSVLEKLNISSDIVVSIDGQHISHNHFTGLVKNTNTIFLLDLCSDFSTGRYLKENKLNFAYFISGHPLSSFANNISNKKFIKLFSGAGTVTITAIDLAINLGFKDIELYGADFAYFNGKAYAKGTYFDTVFGVNNSKINNTEQQYTKLMFRTELAEIQKDKYTTAILNAYKLSLEDYLADNNCIFEKQNDIYIIKHHNTNKNWEQIKSLESFNYNYNNFKLEIEKSDLTTLKYPLLPYIAWLKNKGNNGSLKFIALLKLAQSNIVRYN